ncbi:hypothetical protein GWN42_11775, partial [candidate division KSB1 bacterium]|nr:hypothetical protein [candidate division KSB1 bacterium]
LIKELEVVNGNGPLQLRMLVRTGGRGSVRPDLLVEKIYGLSPDHFEIRRDRLLVERDGKLQSPLAEGLI